MEVKIKQVENVMLSLTHLEAMAIQSILNYHNEVTQVPPHFHGIASGIWKELDELGIASVDR